MSGLEIVGVVASTFQLAEIGIKLSVKLCSFYRQIKDADNSAQRLASDVSLTCSILYQLGKILEQDSQTKLCSQQAFLTAQEVLEECEKIFNQIDEAIQKKDPSSGKNKWERGTRRLTIVILGPDLDVLNSHLDKLKSTMLLMLNVIMYAREINRTSDHSSLECQRQLIETLLREKAETEARLKRLINVADIRSDYDGVGRLSSSTLGAKPSMRVWQRPSTGNEIDKYYDLVKSLLNQIDACQINFQQDRHLRIRDGVVNVHKAELAIFQQSYGKAAAQAFDCPYFRISHRGRDSSFTPKPNSNIPSQTAEASTKRSTLITLGNCHSFGRSPLPAIRRASTSSLDLEAAHKMSRNHPGYREYTKLELKEPMGEMFINQSSPRIRRNSASAADLHETSVGFSMSDLHPVASSGRARSPGPFPSTSNQCVAPREQFDRDYPLNPRYPTAKYSLDRPLSMTVMDEHPHMLRKERPNRPQGPPSTSVGFDNIRVRARPSTYANNGGHDLAPIALPHESDDSCDTYPDRHRRRRRRHRCESDRHGGNRSLEQKALDASSSKLEATSGKESPKKHVAWDTLEDLMLSWTTLPRDMIRL
ncbi:hypothetical protein CBS147332_7963 [Penicillium roqueforti]|nr:hypothetical protein CBS147332_7963 [Penicillium roqueforti]KAI3105328.1 hypothetical protein CBS147331_7019 [Penicillium roqueforti]